MPVSDNFRECCTEYWKLEELDGLPMDKTYVEIMVKQAEKDYKYEMYRMFPEKYSDYRVTSINYRYPRVNGRDMCIPLFYIEPNA